MRFLHLLFAILLFEACERVTYDRYELVYPKTFVFDGITAQPSRFRFSGSNLMDTIPPVTFSSFPDSAAAWLADGRFEPPFETIELLSDSSARISGGALTSELTIPCFRRDANLGIFFNLKFATETGQDSIEMAIYDEGEHLSSSFYIYQYTSRPFQPPFQIVYSPISKCYESSVPELLDYVRQSSEFIDNTDTLAYKPVSFRYR